MTADHGPKGPPPGASPRAHSLARRVVSPIEKFLEVEASSGIVLLIVAVLALAWANSPWASSYELLLHTPISVGFGDHHFSRAIHFWINDILMVIFFFVVGLEVRQELFDGQLSDLRRAALPVAAALGGMLLPAAIYLSLNAGSAAADGWGVPMATDIAFAVGVLALLGRRVPPAVRMLLLALATIDDIGAILVIAIFYSSAISWGGFVAAGAGIGVVLIMQRLGVRHPLLYVLPGVVVWGGILYAGVHPTLAGVLMGLLTPARSWFGYEGFLAETHQALDRLPDQAPPKGGPSALLPELNQINVARREAVPPAARLQALLHPWVAFGVMPLFALANAGVALGGLEGGSAEITPIMLGIGLGLVVGKPLGIVAFSWLAVRLGVAALPEGVSWTGIIVVGCAAGIGFTMALFIGALAFADPSALAVAKLAVLVASGLAGGMALAVGYKFMPKGPSDSAASA